MNQWGTGPGVQGASALQPGQPVQGAQPAQGAQPMQNGWAQQGAPPAKTRAGTQMMMTAPQAPGWPQQGAPGQAMPAQPMQTGYAAAPGPPMQAQPMQNGWPQQAAQGQAMPPGQAMPAQPMQNGWPQQAAQGQAMQPGQAMPAQPMQNGWPQRGVQGGMPMTSPAAAPPAPSSDEGSWLGMLIEGAVSGRGFENPRQTGLMFLGGSVLIFIGNLILIFALERYYPVLTFFSGVLLPAALVMVITNQPRRLPNGQPTPLWARGLLIAGLAAGGLLGFLLVRFIETGG